jgi:predicted PurR-regulated permease PerM
VRLIWLALTGLAIAVLVGLVAGLIWGLGRALQMLSPVLWPLAVAGVLAYLLDPVVDWLQRKGLPRTRAILAVFGIAVALLLALLGSIVPQVVRETRQLIVRVPAYSKKVQTWVEDQVNHPPAFVQKFLAKESPPTEPFPSTNSSPPPDLASTNLIITTNTPASTNAPSLAGRIDKETLQTATSWAAEALHTIGSWLFGQLGRVGTWFGVLAGLALIPVYTFYFLLEKQGISSRWTNYLPVADSGFKQELVFVLNSINNYLIAFFRGQVLVAMCDGILYAIGFLFIGLQYAVLIGAVAIILTMIPFLGAIITCVAALLIALVQFGDWVHPLLVFVVFAIVQALEGLVISPKIMGGKVGLHPLTIIISVMVGTTLLGGVLGGILAIPLTAALRVLMFRYVWKRPS